MPVTASTMGGVKGRTILPLLVLGLIGSISGQKQSDQYNIAEQDSGEYRGELFIPVQRDITDGWQLTLTFDNTVKLIWFDNATIQSTSSDGKEFVSVNIDKTKQLSKGTTFRLLFEADPVKNTGGNLRKAVFDGTTLDLGKLPVEDPIPIVSIGSTGNYDYAEVIRASLLFYEAQRSGKLPANNRVTWRGDSMLNDKGDNGEDLTGGYFDAGDLVKFGFPMAYTITVVAWGVIEHESTYSKIGELENVRAMLKWGTDYFIKAHVEDYVFYGQVGVGVEDHGYWDRPEDWPATRKRDAGKITKERPGSDLASETAAALAATSIVFKTADPTYSATLLAHAKVLYDFADKYRGVYSDSIEVAATDYKSWGGYHDELPWGAAWLLRATNDNFYKTEVEKHYAESSSLLNGRPGEFSWDDKTAGVQVLVAKLTNETKYKQQAQAFCDYNLNSAPTTPKGLVYITDWGSLSMAADAAWICLKAADLGINPTEYRNFAKKQIGYALGDTGRSFVVGLGVNPPSHPHHRGASCPFPPLRCDWFAFDAEAPSPHTLTGALVGGPNQNDEYTDDRTNYEHNEVCTVYNSAFQSTLAALYAL